IFTLPTNSVKAKPRKTVPYLAKKKGRFANSEQVHFLVGFEGVGFKHPRRFDTLILSFFLGGGMSSRLFQEVREKAGLAYSIECDAIPFSDTGILTIYAALAPKSFKQCLAIVGREIQRLCKTPLLPQDLELVKGQLKGTILLSADQMESRQESLGRNE